MKDLYHVGKSRNGPNFDDWLDDRSYKILTDALCHNNKGTIFYDEFLSYALDSEEQDEIVDIHAKLQKEIFKRSKLRLKDFIKLFSVSKTYSKGYVRNSECQNILRKVSSKISEKDCEVIIAYWDTDKEGTVDYQSLAVWLHTGAEPEEVSKTLQLYLVLFYCCFIVILLLFIVILLFCYSWASSLHSFT